MDCIDCHNRPTHIYRSPGQEMDENFVSGHIDPTLPFIKKVAVELLTKPYKSKEDGQGCHCQRHRRILCQELPEDGRREGRGDQAGNRARAGYL